MRLAGDDPGVFVRSMAARGQLGGLAPRAFEAITVMREAVDRVLVETVGVGQSEVEISRLADITAVVIQPGSGDALQFLKAGLMEVFDLLVVNKADLGELAETAARELRSALRVQGRREVPVVSVSAELGTAIDALLGVIDGVVIDERHQLAALRETVLERFTSWHGEKTVRALGGRQVLMAALEAVAEPSPATLDGVLERRTTTTNAPATPGALPSGAKPWAAEVEVDSELAQKLVGEVAPGLVHVTPERLGSGWDNTAWLFKEAQEEWVFRFPRRAIAVDLLARELDVLPLLAPRLPLPITAAQWRGVMPNGWPFGGYRLIRGEVAATAGLEDNEKLALAPVWGAFLRALHSIDPTGLGAELTSSARPEPMGGAPKALGGLPIDPLGKVDVARRWDVTLANLVSTGTSTEAVLRTLDRARAIWNLASERPQVLVHGDLDGRHLIIARDEGRVHATGVIDWGDVMVGDPAIDLGLAYSFLDGAAREAFFDAYGEIDAGTEGLARFRAIASQVWILSWATDIGHAAHAAEARRALVRATR